MLKKSFLAAVCGFLLGMNANAALLDAISVVVDSEPITMYEIYKLSKQFDIPTREALEVLIREKLELSQIKQMNIQVDDFVLNQQVEAIATKNGMSVQSFYGALLKEGVSIDTYRSELKRKLQRDRLYQYILSSKYENIDEDKLLVYYNNNPIEFTKFESFDVVKIEGANADDIAAVFYNDKADKNPTNEIQNITEFSDNQTNNTIESDADEGEISDENLTLKAQIDEKTTHIDNTTQEQNITRSYTQILSTDEDPKVVVLLSGLEVGERTPIIQTDGGFVTYILVSKNGKSVISFEQAKNAIMTKLSSVQESTIIKEYFETVKARASITIIRLP
jgi:parvulin-like peptidyl-prolyl isomerase